MTRWLLKTLAVAGLFVALTAPKAQAVTFASFTQIDVPSRPFSYTTTGTAPTGTATLATTTSVPILVAFDPTLYPTLPFLGGFPVALATLTMTTMTSLGVDTSNVPAIQDFTTSLGMLEIRLLVPVGGMDLFLRVDFTGRLTGVTGGTVATFLGTEPPSDIVTFTSDFVDFSTAISTGLALSFSGVLSGPTDALLFDPATGYFAPFSASGTGTFDVIFAPGVIPEPASYLQIGLGLASLLGLGLLRRSRRSKSLTAA